MSDAFTANDEAFALALLIKEYESYEFAIRKRDNLINQRCKETKKDFHKQCKWEQGRLEPSWTQNLGVFDKLSRRMAQTGGLRRGNGRQSDGGI